MVKERKTIFEGKAMKFLIIEKIDGADVSFIHEDCNHIVEFRYQGDGLVSQTDVSDLEEILNNDELGELDQIINLVGYSVQLGHDLFCRSCSI